jgi:vacuolar-type H+-ATPase subunit F/Vma7
MRTGGVAFVGSAADARGFRLAGVDAVTPAGEAIDRALAGWLAPGATRPALVIISAAADAAAHDRLAALEADPDGPIVLVLRDQAGTPF